MSAPRIPPATCEPNGEEWAGERRPGSAVKWREMPKASAARRRAGGGTSAGVATGHVRRHFQRLRGGERRHDRCRRHAASGADRPRRQHPRGRRPPHLEGRLGQLRPREQGRRRDREATTRNHLLLLPVRLHPIPERARAEAVAWIFCEMIAEDEDLRARLREVDAPSRPETHVGLPRLPPASHPRVSGRASFSAIRCHRRPGSTLLRPAISPPQTIPPIDVEPASSASAPAGRSDGSRTAARAGTPRAARP